MVTLSRATPDRWITSERDHRPVRQTRRPETVLGAAPPLRLPSSRPRPGSPAVPSPAPSRSTRRPTYRRVAPVDHPDHGGGGSQPADRATPRPTPRPASDRALAAACAISSAAEAPLHRQQDAAGRDQGQGPGQQSRQRSHRAGGHHVEAVSAGGVLGPARGPRSTRSAPSSAHGLVAGSGRDAAIGSTRVTSRSGRARASTSPGRPAPEPRSAPAPPRGPAVPAARS